MPPAARVSDPTTHGAPLAPGPGSVNVLIGNMPAWRATIDQHACPAVSITGPDGIGSVMMGSPTVMINNMMACRMGDIVIEKPGLAMGPANPIIMGCPTVLIGDVGMGGAVGGFGGTMGTAKSQAAAYVAPGGGATLGDEIHGKNSTSQNPPKEWIYIQLVNESGKPIADEPFKGKTTDGTDHSNDISGGQRYVHIPGGSCSFTFPNFYDDMIAWDPTAGMGDDDNSSDKTGNPSDDEDEDSE